MLNQTFLVILNMSLTASFVIVGVILARLLLKKAPKIFSYVLWSAVLFRLICPYSFESNFSLIPTNNFESVNTPVLNNAPNISSNVALTNYSIIQDNEI